MPVADGGADAGDAGEYTDAGTDAGVDAGMVCQPCRRFAPAIDAGLIDAGALNELSGLAMSWRFEQTLYAHNDSGDRARFFALGTDGHARGEFRLALATAVDWEDIAVGPCGLSSCIYLADIGDNDRVRASLTIFRVDEADLTLDGPVSDVPYQSMSLQYPIGLRDDAEALLAHPKTGELYLITKPPFGTASAAFKIGAFMPGAGVTLTSLGEAWVPSGGDSRLTAADAHPCGNAVIVRLYNTVLLLETPASGNFETTFSQVPTRLPFSFDELQGESVAFSRDGRSYFTASEGTNQVLHRFDCAEP